MAEALREELLTVPGIAGAEVESDSGVAGVRVQLEAGADPDEVEVAVRRILAAHGMQSTTTAAEETPEGGPPPPPGAPGSVVSFPLVGEHAVADPEAEEQVVSRLESVSVEETPDGISVAIRASDGRQVGRFLASGVGEMDNSVVAAVAELMERPNAVLAGLSEARLGEETVVTVLLALGDGNVVSGSSIQTGGRAYAVAKATWVALKEQA